MSPRREHLDKAVARGDETVQRWMVWVAALTRVIDADATVTSSQEKKRGKKVRITLELSESLIKLLGAAARLNRVANWLPSAPGDVPLPELDVFQIVAWVAYMEGRGARSEEVNAATPPCWRADIDVVSEERRVYDGNKLIHGKELIPKGAIHGEEGKVVEDHQAVAADRGAGSQGQGAAKRKGRAGRGD
jgi:hypothetical protein